MTVELKLVGYSGNQFPDIHLVCDDVQVRLALVQSRLSSGVAGQVGDGVSLLQQIVSLILMDLHLRSAS